MSEEIQTIAQAMEDGRCPGESLGGPIREDTVEVAGNKKKKIVLIGLLALAVLAAVVGGSVAAAARGGHSSAASAASSAAGNPQDSTEVPPPVTGHEEQETIVETVLQVHDAETDARESGDDDDDDGNDLKGSGVRNTYVPTATSTDRLVTVGRLSTTLEPSPVTEVEKEAKAEQEPSPCMMAETCRMQAERLGLQVGGAGFSFTGSWATKGCYGYKNHTSWSGIAWFGTGGTAEQMTAPVPSSQYRILCDADLSLQPSSAPTEAPTSRPTKSAAPSEWAPPTPSPQPSSAPTEAPTSRPTKSAAPSESAPPTPSPPPPTPSPPQCRASGSCSFSSASECCRECVPRCCFVYPMVQCRWDKCGGYCR